MTRECRLHRDTRGVDVSDLADEDRVGVLAQNRAKPVGERDAGLLVDPDLVDVLEDVLDRVFDRHDIALVVVDRGERGVERRGLPRTGRTRADDHAVRRADQLLVALECAGSHPELREIEERARLVEQPQHALLAEYRRGRRHADVEVAVEDGDLELAVLRAPALDDVHVRHHLEAADERYGHRGRERHDFVQGAVGADTDAHAALLRLDVYVRRPVVHGPLEDEVDDPHDGRVLVDGDLLLCTFGRTPTFSEAVLELSERVADLAGVEVGVIDRAQDLARRRDEEAHRRVGMCDELGLELFDRRVADGELDAPALTPDADRAEPARNLR